MSQYSEGSTWHIKRFERYLDWRCNDCRETLRNHISYTTCLFNPGSRFRAPRHINLKRLHTALQHAYRHLPLEHQCKYADFEPVGRGLKYPSRLPCPVCKRVTMTRIMPITGVTLRLCKHWDSRGNACPGSELHPKGWAS